MAANKGVSYEKLSKKRGYTEPHDYFPTAVKKKYGLGEYAKKSSTANKSKKK